MSQTATKPQTLPVSAQNLTPEQLAELKRNFQKPLVQYSEMPADIQSEAIDLIVSAIDNVKQNNSSYEAGAKQVKEAMDRKFGASWHCVIGEGFGYECTHQEQSMILMFYQGTMAVLLFKC